MKYKPGDKIQIVITDPLYHYDTFIRKYDGHICTIEDIRQYKDEEYYNCENVPFLLSDDDVRDIYDQF